MTCDSNAICNKCCRWRELDCEAEKRFPLLAVAALFGVFSESPHIGRKKNKIKGYFHLLPHDVNKLWDNWPTSCVDRWPTMYRTETSSTWLIRLRSSCCGAADVRVGGVCSLQVTSQPAQTSLVAGVIRLIRQGKHVQVQPPFAKPPQTLSKLGTDCSVWGDSCSLAGFTVLVSRGRRCAPCWPGPCWRPRRHSAPAPLCRARRPRALTARLYSKVGEEEERKTVRFSWLLELKFCLTYLVLWFLFRKRWSG